MLYLRFSLAAIAILTDAPMGPRPNPVSGPVFLHEAVSEHLQLAMRAFSGSFAIILTAIMPAQSIRAACLSLLFAVSAYSGVPQAAAQKGAEIQDHLQRAQT